MLLLSGLLEFLRDFDGINGKSQVSYSVFYLKLF